MSWRFLHRARWDAERRAELDSYLAHEIDDGIARGLTPDAARREAYRKLGSPTLIREEIYTMNTIGWLESLWHDARYAFRVLRRSPVFTCVTVLSLALGIGANTAFFELIDAVRLRTLPIAQPESLVEINLDTHGKGRTGSFNGGWPRMTYPIYAELRPHQTALDQLFAWSSGTLELSDGGESRPANALWVSGGFFEGLGIRPALGRLLGAGDDAPGCGDPAVTLGHAFWMRQFGGDPNVLGRALALNGATFHIVGVSQKSFFGLDVGRRFDVAIPICADPLVRGITNSRLDQHDSWWLSVMGRLPASHDLEAASNAIAALSPGIMSTTVSSTFTTVDSDDYKASTLKAVSVATGLSDLRRNYADPLFVLLVISGAVLLIACGNLASLMLARASVRAREMAVRLAIGASRRRLIRQLMVESVLLATAGAALGVFLAGLLSGALVTFVGQASRDLFVDVHIDLRVLGFTAALALITCVVCGLAPALRSTNHPPAAVMRSSGRGLTETTGGRFGLRRVLAMGQLALSLVLTTAALFFAATLRNVTHVDPGFDPGGVLQARFGFRQAGVPPDQLRAFEADFLERVRRVPGVEIASSAAVVPLSGDVWNDTIVIDGKAQRPFPNISRVSGDFFRLMRIPLLAGRTFSSADTPSAPISVVVTESFAKAFFHDASPIGKQFTYLRRPGDPGSSITIVGVVKDIKYADLRETVGPVMFHADTQETQPGAGMTILLRASGDVTGALTNLARSVHPRILVSFTSLDTAIASTTVREQLMASLSALFGLLAALLASVGLYGVIAYAAASRRVEVGIRLALGAERGEVIRMFLKESALLTAVGLGAGAGLAMWAARWASTMFFGITASDLRPLAIAVMTLAVVAVLAAFVPARRASRLELTSALRQD
jgi:putative ABC transport system permease protein